ncbi:MAG: hypothetical protein EAY75_05635 [Bacteroidetes bacterium]|nr:MAG: hypothetical protein EAY75_05635 [Bacteroidota bacterium]
MKTGFIGFFMAMALNAVAQEPLPPVQGKLPTPDDIKRLELLGRFQGALQLPNGWQAKPNWGVTVDALQEQLAQRKAVVPGGQIAYLADGMGVFVPNPTPNGVGTPTLVPPPAVEVMPVWPLRKPRVKKS